MTKQLEAKFYAAGVIDTDGCCERVSDDEAQFWTVYERQWDGTSQAICDCDSRSGADAAADRFNALIAALEQAQQQKAKDFEIKARLCSESNSLHDRLKAAEKRIAELEASPLAVKMPDYRNSPDMHTKQYYETIGFNLGLDACAEAIRAAGGTVSEGE